MLPAIELEIRQVIDDFLAHFESAFEYCESFKHTDIMYFFYETLGRHFAHIDWLQLL